MITSPCLTWLSLTAARSDSRARSAFTASVSGAASLPGFTSSGAKSFLVSARSLRAMAAAALAAARTSATCSRRVSISTGRRLACSARVATRSSWRVQTSISWANGRWGGATGWPNAAPAPANSSRSQARRGKWGISFFVVLTNPRGTTVYHGPRGPVLSPKEAENRATFSLQSDCRRLAVDRAPVTGNLAARNWKTGGGKRHGRGAERGGRSTCKARSSARFRHGDLPGRRQLGRGGSPGRRPPGAGQPVRPRQPRRRHDPALHPEHDNGCLHP